jgi:phosphoribosylglycinamide formyltransferase-1
MRLAILVSGRGTNLAAVLDAVAEGRLSDVEPVLVVSNRPGVPALDVAARAGVPTRVVTRTEYADADARDGAIGRAVTEAGTDLALLAGYDQLLRPAYFAAFRGRTINIHPSLLPRHGGPGMVGLAVHASVLAAGDGETGVTIHEVTPELDGGPPIAQVRVAVLDGDTPERLATRVLIVEHRCLVEVLAHLSASMTAASRA